MKKILLFTFVALFTCSLTCIEGWAQATAQISGTVRDASGAVLPGVEVTATQTETGIARKAVTNETGSYILPNLALGPYRLEAGLPGFRTFVQTGISLQVNSNPAINIVLEVGQVTEQIEVQANAAQVETRSSAVGQVIENERILQLPLNGRQVTDLITLSGAAVQTGESATTSFQGGKTISVAGGLDFGVMYSLDGAMHNNVYDGTQMPMPFPDALQEFKVEASGVSAAGGSRGSGGQVNAVTKSGTNEFHGDAFEFVRNYVLNARNPFAPTRDSLKRNQFGGTLGGPVIKNRLFFFGGYQGTKTRSDSSSRFAFVPTAAMLAGDFRAVTSPECNAGRQVTLRAPFVGNQIDPALFSKPALNIAAKLPKSIDACGRALYGGAEKRDEIQAVAKGDFQASQNHSLFGRYMATTLSLPTAYALTNNVLNTTDQVPGGQGYDNLAQSYALGSTYLFGPSTVNAFRLSVNRTAINRLGAHFFSAPSVGVKGYSEVPDHVRMFVNGGFDVGSRSDSRFTTTAYQLADDISFVRGGHQVTVGGNAAHWRTTQRAHTTDVGEYTFDGSFTGSGTADFLTGKLATLTQQQPVLWSSRQTYTAAYAADSWQARPRLSINYGLRWEPFLPLTITEGAVYHFSLDRFARGVRSTVYPNAVPRVPAGLYYPGDPEMPPGTLPVNRKWGLLSPRVGLAWDVEGNGRTSLRASFGMARDFSGSLTFGGSASSPPFGLSTTITAPAGGFDDPWRDYPGGVPPFPLNLANPQFQSGAQYYYTENLHSNPPTVQNWTLSLQRQFPGNFLLSTSYLGSQTIHLWTREARNDSVFVPGTGDANGNCFLNGQAVPYRVTAGAACSTTGNTNSRRVLALINPAEAGLYGKITARTDGGTQQYHGLLLSLQRRAVRGVNVGANYTWSHCIGDEPNANASGVGGTGFLEPNNRRRDRGNCVASDRRQIFNVTAVASTPTFANSALRKVATGWSVAGIYRYATGDYLTILSGQDRVLSGQSGNQRVDLVKANVYGDRGSVNRFLDPTAFAQPALGTFGTIGRTSVQGPPLWQFDMALSREFRFREAQRLEFRAEAFNITNSLMRKDPIVQLNTGTFGQVVQAGDARIMQFALKYAF
jgi:hypothetical protein